MGCGCGKTAARAARGKEIVGYRIDWPDGTSTPEIGDPNARLLTRIEAQVALRQRNGGSAKGVERSIV